MKAILKRWWGILKESWRPFKNEQHVFRCRRVWPARLGCVPHSLDESWKLKRKMRTHCDSFLSFERQDQEGGSFDAGRSEVLVVCRHVRVAVEKKRDGGRREGLTWWVMEEGRGGCWRYRD